jgi:thiol-disulfide isomerase/thioredoxin
MRARLLSLLVAASLLLVAIPGRADDGPAPATLAQYQAALSAHRPLMVELSAKWCGTCTKMKPTLDQLEGKWKDRVAFLRFDVDTPDGGKLAREKDANALPQFYFIDGNGKVVSSPAGDISDAELESHLEAIVAKTAASEVGGKDAPSSAQGCCGGCCKMKGKKSAPPEK